MWLLKPEVLYEGERSTGNKYVSGLLPANLRVNPVKRGRREHGLKLLAGKQCILKLSVHKFHLPGTFQVLPGQCYEALAGFECCDVQAPGDKAARQLAASAPDLKDMITAPDPRDPARLVDEFVRISRTAAVVLSRDLIKNPAVTTCGRFWQPCHSLASVHARYRDRHVMVAAHRIRIMRTVLRRALGQAVREGIVSWNIAGVVECAAHQGEGRTLTVDQARQHRTKVTKGPGSRAARLAMAFKLIQSAPGSLAIGQRTHLVALVRAGAVFSNGVLIERPEQAAA